MKLLFFVVLVAVTSVAARHRGGKRHHHGPPPPPFLEGLGEDAVKEFFDIKRNENLTIAEQKMAVLAWAQQHGIQEKVVEFEQKRNQHGDELKRNVSELIAELPAALAKFSELMENEGMTRKEQREHKMKLEAEKPEVFAVLKAAFHQFKPEQGRPHGGPNQPPNDMGIRPSGGFPGVGDFGPFRPRGPFRE